VARAAPPGRASTELVRLVRLLAYKTVLVSRVVHTPLFIHIQPMTSRSYFLLLYYRKFFLCFFFLFYLKT
jgi:hypothetical protein